jgi:hypothetical protein
MIHALPIVLSLLLGSPAPATHAGDPGNGVASAPAGFRIVDVFVDSSDRALAAYQVEIHATENSVRIVGIEGGEAAAFREPPYYDPKAIQGERVILAAFSTEPADRLPTGRTRVASLHLQVLGDVPPSYSIRLKTAATEGAQRIAAKVSLEPRNNE